MEKWKKYTLISILGILFVLLITNPSTNQFKEFLNAKGSRTESNRKGRYQFGRLNNYFIYSIYTYTDTRKNEKEAFTYIGILSNFIFIGTRDIYFEEMEPSNINRGW